MSNITQELVRHAMLVRAGLVAGAALLMLLAMIVPLWSNSRETAAKIGVRQKEAEEISKRVAVLSGLDREILRRRVEVLDDALPPKKDVLLYLSAVDGLSRELGLTFSGISLSPGDVTDASGSATGRGKTVADSVPGVHSLETEIKINGTRDSIYAFLRLVEQSLPLMQVKDVKVTASGGESYLLSLRLAMLWASGDLSKVKGTITLFDEKEEDYFQQLAQYRRFTPVVNQSSLTAGGSGDLFAPETINLIGTPEATDGAIPQ